MRSTFGIIMLALVDGEPRMLSLKQALRVYLDHRLVVIRRRAEYELEKARARLHILEGLRIALKHLDEIIDLIKKAPDADIARDRLMKRYRLTEIQAQAILDMQLRRLAALERKKIEDEYKDLLAQIKNIESLLKSPIRMRQSVATELQQVKENYGDRRRTQITRLGAGAKSVLPVLTAIDLLPEQTVWVSATSDGLISRTLDDRPPRISGSMAPRFLLQVNTRDTLFLVSSKGEAAGIPVQTLPEAPNPQDGSPMHKVSALSDADHLAALFTLPPKEERLEGWYILTATQQGMVKKTPLEDLPGPTGHSFTLVKVNEDDQLGWVRLTDGQAEIMLVTADGMAIRFHENDIRPMGLVAAGVNGIKLGARDRVIGMELIPARGEILLIASDGKAKRVELGQFPLQGRYGQGVIAWKLPSTSQLVGVAAGKPSARITVLLDKLSPKAMRLDEAALQTRAASGKSVIDLKAGIQVLGLSIPWAVPRPVAGEKATPQTEIMVPEEADEQSEKEVEQLSFGMPEPVSGARTKEATPRKRKSVTAQKPKTAPARRKSNAVKAGGAALITKIIAEPKKVQAPQDNRSKAKKAAPPTPAKTSTGKRTPTNVEKPVKKTGTKPTGTPHAKNVTKPASKSETVKTGSKSAPQATGKTPATKTKTSSANKTKSVKKESPTKSKSAVPASQEKKPKTPVTRKVKPSKKSAAKGTGVRKSKGTGFTVKSKDVVLPNVVIPPGWKPPTKKVPQLKRKPPSTNKK
jgi:DNA gyrase subunit A